MRDPVLHRFALDGSRYVIDPETSFCFECDEVSWDVIEHYPHTPPTRIAHLLEEKHGRKVVDEVVGELEWLRQTKAILPGRSLDEIKKQFELDTGCREMNVALSGSAQMSEPWVAESFSLLLARSGAQKKLQFHLELPEVRYTQLLSKFFLDASRLARLGGKEVEIALRIPACGGTLHCVFSSQESIPEALTALAATDLNNASKTAKTLDMPCFSMESHIEIPVHDNGVLARVQALEKAGYRHIRLDLIGAFLSDNPPKADDFFKILEEILKQYADDLGKGKTLRLEGLARLFSSIYNGTGQKRSDPSGTNALAVDRDGTIYPSAAYRAAKLRSLGKLMDGVLDSGALARFDDLGVHTTPECMRCWARNLCGGGNACVNEKLSGAWNTPQAEWCEGQRRLIARAVATFNTLNQNGVNFNRVYSGMRPAKLQLGMLKMAWAAMRMQVGMRPLEEGDAPLLKRWEDWNDASYFTLQERGVLTTTVYEREMDALHPRGIAQEFILTRKNGQAMGLLRVQPSTLPNTLHVALFFAKAGDYRDDGVAKSLRLVLEQAAKQQAIRHVLVETTAQERDLDRLLSALRFTRVGVRRDALYLHNAYHDIQIHHAEFGT